MNKREEILQAIINYIQEHGYSPSVREIGKMVGLNRTSSVHAHLQQMFELGVIETDTDVSTPRAIRVPGYKFVKAGDNSDMQRLYLVCKMCFRAQGNMHRFLRKRTSSRE